MADETSAPPSPWKMWGAIVAVMVGLATLHAAFVVPAVLADARAMMIEEIDRDNSYRKASFDLFAKSLEKLATKESINSLKERLDRIEGRLHDLEKKK